MYVLETHIIFYLYLCSNYGATSVKVSTWVATIIGLTGEASLATCLSLEEMQRTLYGYIMCDNPGLVKERIKGWDGLISFNLLIYVVNNYKIFMLGSYQK